MQKLNLPKNQNNYYLRDQHLGALIYLHFVILILICFLLIMPAVNYVTHGYSSLRTTPGVITLHELHTGGKTLLQLLLKIG